MVVLFDMDGTLLPMDQEKFMKVYFSALAAHFAPLGYEPKALLEGVWQGTLAMVNNDGRRTNEEVFWDTFSGIFGERVFADRGEFEKFYAVRFDAFREACGYNPAAGEKTQKGGTHRRPRHQSRLSHDGAEKAPALGGNGGIGLRSHHFLRKFPRLQTQRALL